MHFVQSEQYVQYYMVKTMQYISASEVRNHCNNRRYGFVESKSFPEGRNNNCN